VPVLDNFTSIKVSFHYYFLAVTERIKFLKGEDKRLVWPNSSNLLFVQNVTSTLEFFNTDLSK